MTVLGLVLSAPRSKIFKARNPSIITREYATRFFSKNVEEKRKPGGGNSFVAPFPYWEYQLDLFFISKNGWENFPKFRMGLVLIDFFTKYAVVVPIKPKSPSDVLVGMMEGIQKMGRKPKMLYSDEESSFHKTRRHPVFAERFIRTFKEMFFKALSMTKKGETQYTEDRLYPWILLTCNDKTVHSATGLTPKQAREPKNEIKTKLNISQSN